ncbi:MAG: ABC transporter permease subunit [Ignavibacteriaceae bacterium]|nr:ABC transporter permease subunit [Ignavibacteriaceae bacterium]HRN26263.1 ABC transporter permease subunit [Ignavibacteriaceae bacterium]HRP91900.1 ABC transporter permease subunit [Ignavibacteriaceae bacterium]HRQ53847.1 ABC transporter permease subunit [Ignavibacteriaceae bacterium]
MELIYKIIKFELSNAFRSKWILIYSAFFLLTSFLLLNFGEDNSKAILSLMNIVLIVIPLVSIIFGTIYVYNSNDYIQMVLCQPIDRKSLFIGLYLGNSIPLAAGFLFGTLIGFILNGYANFSFENFILLLIVGAALTFIFTSISFLIGIKFSDKSRGLGFAIIIWLLLSVAYDGIVLFVIYYFRDYPIENIVLAISLLNPIDLGRIMFILNFDISALMGYTGALFHKFFGSALGIIISFSLLFLWLIIPTFWGLKSFKKKDF